jgi:hypothetical protein
MQLNFGYHVRALLLARTTSQPLQGAPSALRVPRASDFPRSHARIGITTVLSAHTMYGYDRERFDDAQRHDARRRHARHPPLPDDDTRPMLNVYETESLALGTRLFIPKTSNL